MVHRGASPFPLPLHNGGNTGLRFYYLTVEDYTQGISFNGQAGHSWHNSTFYVQPSAGVNDNDVSGMTFLDIGDRYAPGQTGYGVILFTDSSHDTITNNTFNDIYNTGDTDQLHPLYITHFSSSSTIDKNLFEHTNGEAVKVRDRSNNNNIFSNTFNATGGVSAYLDDFCDQQCVNRRQPEEVPRVRLVRQPVRGQHHRHRPRVGPDPGRGDLRRRRSLLDPQGKRAPAHRGKQNLTAGPGRT